MRTEPNDGSSNALTGAAHPSNTPEIACPPLPGDDLAFPWRSLYLCPMLARMDELARAERYH